MCVEKHPTVCSFKSRFAHKNDKLIAFTEQLGSHKSIANVFSFASFLRQGLSHHMNAYLLVPAVLQVLPTFARKEIECGRRDHEV